jgi:hypothetical protein
MDNWFKKRLPELDLLISFDEGVLNLDDITQLDKAVFDEEIEAHTIVVHENGSLEGVEAVESAPESPVKLKKASVEVRIKHGLSEQEK